MIWGEGCTDRTHCQSTAYGVQIVEKEVNYLRKLGTVTWEGKCLGKNEEWEQKFCDPMQE